MTWSPAQGHFTRSERDYQKLSCAVALDTTEKIDHRCKYYVYLDPMPELQTHILKSRNATRRKVRLHSSVLTIQIVARSVRRRPECSRCMLGWASRGSHHSPSEGVIEASLGTQQMRSHINQIIMMIIARRRPSRIRRSLHYSDYRALCNCRPCPPGMVWASSY